MGDLRVGALAAGGTQASLGLVIKGLGGLGEGTKRKLRGLSFGLTGHRVPAPLADFACLWVSSRTRTMRWSLEVP